MSDYLRIIFAGTPQFASPYLLALLHSKHKIVGVFTQPDSRAGRGYRINYSPIKQIATRYHLPIFQPISLREINTHDIIAKLNADIMVVVAYGLILPQSILTLLRKGCINVHGSLLPRWRGAAPIQRALLAGDDQTGITIIQLDSGLDTGVILNQVECDIKSNDTSAVLHNKLSQLGLDVLLMTLKQISTGCVVIKPQNNVHATYAYKLSKKEAKLDWHLSAVQLERSIRAFNPWPISYFYIMQQRIRVWAANFDEHYVVSHKPGTILAADKIGIHVATGKGLLILTTLQLENKKIISVHDILNSRRDWFLPGTVLN